MTLTEFFAEIGDDNLGFQLLAQCMTNVRDEQQGTHVSFETDAISAANVARGTGRVGLIVWADRDAFERATAKANQAKPT
ncbi:hypothetical protein [Burkholderia mayonis]|uniref:Uncharacterized protein n=1 Tax=Burkholderia mayonis TaxID=1385591 RepID=A0A1B4G6Y9_9BURK|nr:hypothetical protein [Burkholderia mayonis]AOJ11692.1 hypothetical protein WS71_32155 [Burkholderia mayonis]KVE54596.1 hypothetical protein WS71_04010 [Burkholderia mayonis]